MVSWLFVTNTDNRTLVLSAPITNVERNKHVLYLVVLIVTITTFAIDTGKLSRLTVV